MQSMIKKFDNKIYTFPNQTTIKSVACGDNHVLALTEQGQVFAFGQNELHQCGLTEQSEAINSPKQIEKLKDKTILYILCGSNHSCAIDSDAEYYLWGTNKNHECIVKNMDKENESVVEPTEIQEIIYTKTNLYVTYIALGRDNTSLVIGKSKQIQNSNEFNEIEEVKYDEQHLIESDCIYHVRGTGDGYLSYQARDGNCRQVDHKSNDSQFGFVEIDKEKQLYHIINKYRDERKDYWLGISKRERMGNRDLLALFEDTKNRVKWQLIPENDDMCFKIKCYQDEIFKGWLAYEH
eukprot:49928_1